MPDTEMDTPEKKKTTDGPTKLLLLLLFIILILIFMGYFDLHFRCYSKFAPYILFSITFVSHRENGL